MAQNREKKLQISVIGSSHPDPEFALNAREVGRIIATSRAVLIYGGLGGVMEEAARGAKERDGITIGILPDYNKESANPFIDILLPTGLEHARNVLVVASADLVVALPGSHGTQSEIAIALKLGKPVIGFRAWSEIDGVHYVNDINELEKELLLFF